MALKTDTYPVDIRGKCNSLGCLLHQDIVMLPTNFINANTTEEFIFNNSTKTIFKVLNGSGLDVSVLGKEQGIKGYQHTKTADIVLPALFVSYTLLTHNPMALTILLNVVSSFVYDTIRGFPGKRNVKLEIVCEKKPDSVYKRITFEGSADSLNSTVEEIIELIKETDKHGKTS